MWPCRGRRLGRCGGCDALRVSAEMPQDAGAVAGVQHAPGAALQLDQRCAGVLGLRSAQEDRHEAETGPCANGSQCV